MKINKKKKNDEKNPNKNCDVIIIRVVNERSKLIKKQNNYINTKQLHQNIF